DGAAALGTLDEVGVLRGDRCRSVYEAAEAGAVDQLAGGELAGDRVDEHRARVLAAGLMLATPAHDVVELSFRSGSVSRSQPDPRLDDNLMTGEVAAAEAQP